MINFRHWMLLAETLADLTEAREAPLYHWMESRKAMNVFQHDAIPVKWQHDIPGMGQVQGISMSRNKRFTFGRRAAVRLTIDQDALASRHKIIPLDGEAAWRRREELPPTTFDRGNPNEDWKFAEEFVVTNIRQLHRYVSEILLIKVSDTVLPIELYDVCVAYSEQWHIPFKTNPTTLGADVAYWHMRNPSADVVTRRSRSRI